MNFECITYSTDKNIALITLNRPDKLNALNNKTISELEFVFDSIKNDNQVKAVILTGSGEKAFAAGADISELQSLNQTSAIEFSQKGQQVFSKIENLGKPVIAAINGYALGGGCELALACHIRYASQNAKFGLPELNLGTIPGYGGTQRLTRTINHNRALELILSGDFISADEAFRLGLVNKIFPLTELLSNAFLLAEKIVTKSSFSISCALNAVLSYDKILLEQGLQTERELFGQCINTSDFIEGTTAFLEKRKPVFKNE